MSKILGIDLGTTNSAMAVVQGGEPRIVENKEGNRTTPSIMAIQKGGERVVGLLAKRQAVTNSQNTVYSVKRLIGRKYSDAEVQRDKKLLPYEIKDSADGSVEVKMGDRWHKPQEISAMILQKLKQDAEDKLGEKITEAVITVPAYFDDSQRKATKEAGEIAGLTVKRILNEPTAAALAYGFGKGGEKGRKGEEKIVVYDFGGGTFDVSVLEISQDTVEVRSTGGDTHLGGDDFDQKIIHYLIDEFKKDQGMDLSKDILALQRLKEAAEKAKHELSSTLETEVNIPFITTDANGPKHFLTRFTRAKLEDLVRNEIERSVEITKKTVADAGFKLSEINEVILVGGQTRMPAIQEAVKKLFGKEPHKNINPDEVVALGAAVQAGVFQGDVKDILLLDVTPLSLGLETLGGVMTVLINKNTTIPAAKTQIFSTAADNQPQVEIHVLQGERPMAADNKTLGRFILDGIPPAPRGTPQVEVVFDIDANGILSVSAKDKATGKTQSIKIEGSSGLSKEEIERMKKEAELHAAEDAKRKEASEARIMAETLIYSVEKTLRDLGDPSASSGQAKIPAEIKKEIEEKLDDLKGIKDSADAVVLKSKTEALSQAIQKIGADLYKQAEADKSANAPGEKKADDKDEPKEGEFRDKNI
ncbi:MAG: molecular chaperone DnaK [Parcubacteria group bacterium]|nr:molecular chaperone DnaK [Parcubacteria group bacterium]